MDKLHFSTYANYLAPRPRDWHKGLAGHVLIIGGAPGFLGAPRMAGEAALRVGAGLVSIATHANHAALMAVSCPELMCHAIKEASELGPLLSKANVVLLGPGLSQSDWGKALWEYVLQSPLPMVIDADALNLLSQSPQKRDHWILTPHPAEAGRLLHQSTEMIQKDRIAAIQAIHHRYGGVSVLKGAGTLVLATNESPLLCDKGNPGMASAGMGDVLSGVISGFLAQGVPLAESAKLGVLLHATAGDLAAKDGERGMIATDLMPYLRRLANEK